MTTISLKKLINVDELKEGSGFSNPHISINLGYDNKIYALLKEKEPPQIVDGFAVFPNTKADTKFCCVIISIDWTNYTVTKKKIIHIGELKQNYNYILPLGDEFLLVGCRCWNKKNGPENNAYVVDKEGTKIREFCLGDGISSTITTADGKIITGYFDEGVYGNFGWDNPIGHCGLIEWDKNGNKIWENDKYPIDDVYAMDYYNNNLYFYYYYDFGFVKTDLKSFKDYRIGENGFKNFTISEDEKKIIVDGGYNDHSSFYIYDFGDGIGENKREVTFEIDGNKAEKIYPIIFHNSKMIFGKDDNLFISNFI